MTVAPADAVVTWTQVDGVNVAWGEAPGPLRASLIFRVGKADEALPYNGITHLVEHLTLFPLGQVPHYQNGSVRTTLTSFDTAGDPEEVVAFLDGVCRGLSRLPTERLEAEVRVVEAEAARKPGSTHTALLAWRYGATGPGLWGFDEYATRTVTPDSLQKWADQVFARENAVLVLTGPPPVGLRLPLSSRGRLQPPALRTVPPVLPAWFRHGFQDVAVSTVLARSVGATAYGYVLQHRLTDRLRYELGLAYSPAVDYDPYDGEVAHLVARADAHPDHVARVAEVLAEVVDELAATGPDPTVLDEYKGMTAKQRLIPGYAAGCAGYEATQLLTSGVYRSMAEVNEESAALTSAQVHEAAIAARASMLLGLPKDVAVPDGWETEAPPWSIVPPVKGVPLTRELTVEQQPGVFLVGPEGITRDFGEGRVVTTRYADTVAVLARPDGQRVLIASDALSITLEPRLWREGFTAVAQIDEATAQVRVSMPERDSEDIPSVPANAPGPMARKGASQGAASAATGAAAAKVSGTLVTGALLFVVGVVVGVGSLVAGHYQPGGLLMVIAGSVVMRKGEASSRSRR